MWFLTSLFYIFRNEYSHPCSYLYICTFYPFNLFIYLFTFQSHYTGAPVDIGINGDQRVNHLLDGYLVIRGLCVCLEWKLKCCGMCENVT
jgi:hypothetical protein